MASSTLSSMTWSHSSQSGDRTELQSQMPSGFCRTTGTRDLQILAKLCIRKVFKQDSEWAIKRRILDDAKSPITAVQLASFLFCQVFPGDFQPTEGRFV